MGALKARGERGGGGEGVLGYKNQRTTREQSPLLSRFLCVHCLHLKRRGARQQHWCKECGRGKQENMQGVQAPPKTRGQNVALHSSSFSSSIVASSKVKILESMNVGPNMVEPALSSICMVECHRKRSAVSVPSMPTAFLYDVGNVLHSST